MNNQEEFRDIPKIYQRRIIKLRKPNGSIQYFLTLPKEYAEALENKGIDDLLVIFDYGIGVFPKDNMAEKALLAFMMKHSYIKELFTKKPKGGASLGGNRDK